MTKIVCGKHTCGWRGVVCVHLKENNFCKLFKIRNRTNRINGKWRNTVRNASCLKKNVPWHEPLPENKVLKIIQYCIICGNKYTYYNYHKETCNNKCSKLLKKKRIAEWKERNPLYFANWRAKKKMEAETRVKHIRLMKGL